VLPSTTRKQLYNALVLPHMDYCSVVWQNCSRELRRKLERVQNYGIRLILSQPPRTHSEEMRQRLNWLTLEKRRVMARLCMMHRCVLKEYSMKSLSKSNSNGTRGVGKLFLPRPQTDFFKNSFTFKGIQDWNCLQSDVRTTIPLGNIYGLQRQASYCIFNVCIYSRHSLELDYTFLSFICRPSNCLFVYLYCVSCRTRR